MWHLAGQELKFLTSSLKLTETYSDGSIYIRNFTSSNFKIKNTLLVDFTRVS